MKKFISIFVLFLCFFTLCSCNKNNVEDNDDIGQVTITFIQEDVEDIIITINKGEGLSIIPNPTIKVGYSVVWDRSDFTNITTNITVRAIYTPHEYQITYELNNEKATISSQIQKVKYDANFVLKIPSCEGYNFISWKIKDTDIIFKSGKWTYTKSITLVAQWEEIEGWTKNY